MTKDELLKKFDRIGVAPPEGASKDELERTWQETVRNIRSADHPLAEKLTKEDVATADALLEEAASYDQVNVEVGGTDGG